MKLLNKIWTSLIIAQTMAACSDKDNLDLPPPVGLGGEIVQPTSVDQWLRDSLTVPYNIAVKYKWNPFELNLSPDQTLTPPDESKIIPAMSAIKRVWIDPYNAETGSDFFIRKFSPKQFNLIGSVQYSFETVLLGQAEGGNNIAFFDINQNFDKDPVSSIRRMILTSHHEFAHILHQYVLYPSEFQGISAQLGLDGYTATWFNISEAEALSNGYITPYAMASYDEDFAEMISNMLMEGRPRFEDMIASTNPAAQQALRAKEQIVVNYFQEVWNINFYSLQNRVQAALNNMAPPLTPVQTFGAGKNYTVADVDPDNQIDLPQSAHFNALVATSRDSVAAIPNVGLTLDSFALMISSETESILRMYIKQNNNVFRADFTYATTRPADNFDFTFSAADQNGALIQNAVAPLLSYFENNIFGMTWHADPSVSVRPRIKFTPTGSPGNYFVARLLRQ